MQVFMNHYVEKHDLVTDSKGPIWSFGLLKRTQDTYHYIREQGGNELFLMNLFRELFNLFPLLISRRGHAPFN